MQRTHVGLAVALLVGLVSGVSAQDRAAPAPSTPTAVATGAPGDKPNFKPEELEQIMAPVALYPDSLLSQILMASTYPIEIVQADRWVKQYKDLKGDELATALENADWDPSVKSLVNFPDVLAMMSDKLDWTQQLGDAFIGQQKEVMEAVQRLRARAQAAGKLESSKEQVIKVEQGPTQTIVIESANPDVIYVPAYSPTVVYGTWPYPAYPPYPYYPPGYTVGAAAIGFGVGVACGAAWGYAWGNCNWRGGDVDIDINQNINRNTNINRNNYTRNTNIQNGKGQWQHNAAHRGNTPYRNSGQASQYGGKSATQAAQSRDAYRGRADAGRQQLGSTGAAQNRTGGAQATQTRSGGNSAFQGADRGGSAARAESNRGNSSRSGSNVSRSSPTRSSPSRSGGGGGSRGGGGGGRGGGGRR